MVCNRRTFIKSSLISGGALALGGAGFHCNPQNDIPSFYLKFAGPPSSARPFFRWWWNGNRVTADEIRRELRLMYEQGAGGVEVNPIALDEQIYTTVPGKPLEWLSKEWLKMIRVTVQEAHSLGMIVDLIVGTGWPFGGGFLTPEETIQGVELEIVKFRGPQSHITRIDVPNDDNHKLMQAILFPAHISSLDEGLDVTDQVATDGSLRIDVPYGDHELYIITWRNRFREVLFGAPGADGPVLDHFNKSAVNKYLNRMSNALKSELGDDLGKYIRSMFCDSIELEGANWTGDMAAQFEQRRGYALHPWLPLILNRDANARSNLADKILRARYDMSLTLAELFMERFIQPFHEWCHQNNVLSRYQAYGYPWLYTDLLDGYLAPDIPESDQWLYNRGWVPDAEIDEIRYAIWNKYTSSGAHLAGRNVISCEAMTNSKGVFRTSLEYIKQATDLDTVCGINHLVLHGFNYSPPEAGFPGWIRFGTYYNEHNTWWPFAKKWFDYAARLAYIFQNSQAVSQIAILGNTPDKWSEFGLDRNPWNMNPHYLHQLWQALNHYGYQSDYINNTILRNTEFADGCIQYGPMQYQVLLITDVHSLNEDTALALDKYAEAGGRIIFIGSIPDRAPGMNGQDDQVQQTIQHILREHSGRVREMAAPEEGSVIPWTDNLVRALNIAPDIRISKSDTKLFFIHHVKADKDIYFLSNQDRDKTLGFEAEFPTGKKTPWRLDAETGERYRYTLTGQNGGLMIELGPLESLLLVFEPVEETITGKEWQPVVTDRGGHLLNTPWQVELEHVDGRVTSLMLGALQDLSALPQGKDFSGTATYTTEFRASFSGKMVLDLGEVHEIAGVTLNGKELGTTWWGRRQYVINDLPANKTHTLEIKVTNLLFNYCRSLKDNKAAQHWVERTGRTTPEPSGLLGPVRLYKVGQRVVGPEG